MKYVYIGRFHVPFTPGLIPKEKDRIASSIGEVISKYLLDDATIQSAICDLRIKEKASVYVHDLILRMKQVTISLEVLLDQKGVSNSVNIMETRLRDTVGNYVTEAVVESDLIDDLIESALKRFYGVKDSGKILPGHGGILDRFDSMLLVMPCLYLLGII